MVGWLTSQQSTKSQAQTSSASLSWRRIASLVGSAAAWSRRTSGSVWRFMFDDCIDIHLYRQVSIQPTTRNPRGAERASDDPSPSTRPFASATPRRR